MDEEVFVSGFAFHKLCKWSICDRYPQNLHLQTIEENDLVFLNLDFLPHFLYALQKSRPNNKFLLITHNSDLSFTNEYAMSLLPYVNRIFAINCICDYKDIVKPIPIGFRDWPIHSYEIIKTIPRLSKTIFVYMNFDINTNIEKRTHCYNAFSNKSWVYSNSGLNLETFYKQMSSSKYVLSPDGTGIDCHRIYESLYFDAIPILKKNEMYEYYEKLPVLLVDDWSQISESFLEENYRPLYETILDWKKKNPNWLSARFWLDYQD
uniref:RXYLT1 C-terminal domain-containing protein n=1 Tax=viral metagenome TaxID=1070528 RepID=A0A6C0JGJ1_9ZZZZ